MDAAEQPISLTRVLRQATAEQSVTMRELAKRTRDLDERGRGLTHGYLSTMIRGLESPTVETLELVCSALEIDPALILEYRLAQVRRAFDERLSGPDVAAANLELLTRALADAGEDLAQHPADLVDRDLDEIERDLDAADARSEPAPSTRRSAA